MAYIDICRHPCFLSYFVLRFKANYSNFAKQDSKFTVMKHIYLYLIIIVTCILSSCNLGGRGKGVLPKELIQAENIMYENPDSALQILQKMTIPTEKEAHATWALFLTQAKYRCLIEQNDSLINISYEYFNKKEDSERKALLLYLKGGLLYEKNQYEHALKFYLKAEEEIERIPNDTLGYLITSHICMIYAYQKLYDYAIEYGWKSNKHAMKSKHINYIIMSYIRIARANGTVDLEEAVNCYEKAISIANEHKLINLKASALVEVAGVYKHDDIKNYSKALSCIKEAMRIRENKTDQSYIVLGDLFRRMNEPDSAYCYLSKAARSKNIHTSRSAYKSLYDMSQDLGHYKEAVEYSSKMWEMQDSINNIAREKILIEMQEKYDQQRVINEKNKAEKRGLIILCVSIGVIGIIITCYQRKILHQSKILKRKEKELTDFVNQLNENKQVIAKNTARIKELEGKEELSTEMQKEKEKSIDEMQKQNKSLENLNQDLLLKIDEYTANMAEKSKEIERLRILSDKNLYLHKRELFLCNELLKKEEFVNKIKKNPKPLDVIQWRDIMSKTDAIYDNYTIRLRTRIPELTENDIRICCLIKLSFSNGDVAKILSISPTSVSRQKLRLKERIIQQVGSLGDNVLLDIWLKEF